MATSSRHRGFYFDAANSRLQILYNGTEAVRVVAAGVTVPGTLAVTGASTLTGNVVASGTLGVTGVLTASAESRIANGFNQRIGTINAFATTQPTNALVMFQGTAYAGAITTSGGIQSTATVLTKIIAAGTVSNIET